MDYCNQHLMEIRQKYDTLLQQLQQTHTFHIHSSFAIKPKGSRDHIDPAGQSQSNNNALTCFVLCISFQFSSLFKQKWDLIHKKLPPNHLKIE